MKYWHAAIVSGELSVVEQRVSAVDVDLLMRDSLDMGIRVGSLNKSAAHCGDANCALVFAEGVCTVEVGRSDE